MEGIAVDCCADLLRMIWPLKADFPCQSEGTFKQYTEVLIRQKSLNDSGRFSEIRTSGVLELVSCGRAEWTQALGFQHKSEVRQFLAEVLIVSRSCSDHQPIKERNYDDFHQQAQPKTSVKNLIGYTLERGNCHKGLGIVLGISKCCC